MRYLALIISTAALTGCSVAGLDGSHTSSCAPHCNLFMGPGGANYATQNYNQAYNQPGYSQSRWQSSQPTGYSTPSPNSYGTHAYAPVPQLRGLSNPHSPRGYKYGEVGGILYDFDSENFGIQGRIGYQSAVIVGAELEGSISLGADTEELSAEETAAIMGATDVMMDTTAPATGTTAPAGGTTAPTVGPVDATATASSSTLTTEFTNSIAAFGLARLPVSDRLSVHSRVGIHSTRFKSEIDDGAQVFRQNETSVGIAYGVGMNYALTPRNDIRLDYTVYDRSGQNADSLSAAFAYKF